LFGGVVSSEVAINKGGHTAAITDTKSSGAGRSPCCGLIDMRKQMESLRATLVMN